MAGSHWNLFWFPAANGFLEDIDEFDDIDKLSKFTSGLALELVLNGFLFASKTCPWFMELAFVDAAANGSMDLRLEFKSGSF